MKGERRLLLFSMIPVISFYLYWKLTLPLCCCSISGVSASFGEMLLLVAMYFHSNQLSAIIDLVCSTLGMKVNPKLFLTRTFLC